MQENYELVQKGFRILVGSMSGYIGQVMNRIYKDRWWYEVLEILNNQRDLPLDGTYDQLIDSLDVANCIRIIQKRWKYVFSDLLHRNCNTWATELMWFRNITAHLGQQDLDQPTAERALNTMTLLCKEIDPDAADEIMEIYQKVRARADDYAGLKPMSWSGLNQPESCSKRGALEEGSLLQLVDTEIVQKTTMTRKVTYGGKTEVYPVYRIRLDALYYNDQNDRIATWITRYESENGENSLTELDAEIYNRVIEGFICESNPDAIQKTQKNIALVGQREPGVALADGRVVDGNRRFTCLRRLQRETSEPLYFETVIMDMDIHEDKKQIKLLELAIQHGEESKVGYDLIDYAIGTYRDIVLTNLLTIDEYASSTNEKKADVKKRLEIAEIICEFLEYIKLPGQYHAAREYQVYSLFSEMIPVLRKLDEEGKQKVKTIAFNNTIMKGIKDQRKFIRDLKKLADTEAFTQFLEQQEECGKQIQEKLSDLKVASKGDLDQLAEKNPAITEELQMSMEKALLRSRSQQLRAKPADKVSECTSLLMEVDPRLFSKMNIEEKENLRAKLNELTKIIDAFQRVLSD